MKSKPSLKLRALASGMALALAAPVLLAAGPVAEQRNVPITLHGTTLPDPYRWLEDVKSPQSQAWLRGQGAAARSVLDRIDGREATARRLAELAQAQGDSVRGLTRMPGERFYYLKRARGESQFKLVMRQGLDGKERTLFDPEQERVRTGVPHAINYFKPAWDGAHIAYGVSAAGSEDASLFVLHIASGKQVGQPVPRVYETAINWLPDSRSLLFTQLAAHPASAPVTDTYKDSRVLWLKLGQRVPKAVFGPTVTSRLGLDRLDVAEIMTQPGSRWMVARTTDTTVPEGKLYVAPLSELGSNNTHWRAFATAADQVHDVELRGDQLFVLTHKNAPRRKLVVVDLTQPDMAGATTVVPEPRDAVLEAFQLTPTAVVTTVRQGTAVVLRRHERGARADLEGRTLPAPAPGVAWLSRAPAQDSDALIYSFSGWTEPPRSYRLDGDKSVEVSFGLRAVPPGLPEVQVTDITFPSHDGVLVPMTILHRKGLALDGKNPVLLHGYASYGFSQSASFSADDTVWMERGGVLAYLNPRGSGVYGDDWHRAGFKTTKPNTWKDGIAAARYLIAKGYGSAQTMGIMGTSAGGIFVGRATTEAPELFAAAIYNVGMLDTVRSEESANGVTNVSEFGTVQDAAEFKALLAMSTYHNIKDGTAYPGVMLVHGMNDPRVDVWQSGKTAARLQAANPNGRPVLLRLDAQAGHGIGSTLNQRQSLSADVQSFLLWQMGKTKLND